MMLRKSFENLQKNYDLDLQDLGAIKNTARSRLRTKEIGFYKTSAQYTMVYCNHAWRLSLEYERWVPHVKQAEIYTPG
jgi:hypothetical protein